MIRKATPYPKKLKGSPYNYKNVALDEELSPVTVFNTVKPVS